MIIKAEVVWRVPVVIDVDKDKLLTQEIRNKIILHAYEAMLDTMPQITKCDEIPEVVSV